MDLTAYTGDEKRITEGVLMEWSAGDDVQFRVASTESPKYKKALRDKSRKFSPYQLKKNPELAEKAIFEAMAKGIFLGWEGELKLKGKVLDPNSEEDRTVALEECPPLREWVSEESQEISNFQTEAEAEEKKALGKRSGSS